MNIHVGYVTSNGKVPTMKKDSDQTWEDVMLTEPPSTGDYMGVLSNTIGFVDTDTAEDSERLLEWSKGKNIPILQTDKGYHAYFTIPKGFANTKNGYITPLGIRIDWRVGSDNCRMDCLKNNGRKRYWIKTGELTELPLELRPIYKADTGLCGLGEGGRDVALFNHFNKLLVNGIAVEEFETFGKWINEHVLAKPYEDMYKFYRESQYVKLKEKLDSSEKKLQLGDYVNLVLDKFDFVYIDGQLHYYDNGIYTNDMNTINRYLIKLDANVTDRKRKEIYTTIKELTLGESNKRAEWYMIPFKNGYLNAKTFELLPYSKDVIFTKRLPINWNPNSNSTVLDKVMNNVKDGKDEVELALYEMLGYALLDTCKLNRAFILVGDGSNGKSTILEMIKAVIGEEGFSPLTLSQCTEKFCTHMLYNKFANIGEDISNAYKKETDVFKCLTDGNTIKAEKKGQDGFLFNSTATLIFACNDIPKLGNGTDKKAILRRIQFIPFTANFDSPAFKKDLTIKDKLHDNEVLESLACRAVMSIHNIITLGMDFTAIDSVEKDEYEESLAPLSSIIDEVGTHGTAKEVYNKYKSYCYDVGLTPLGLFQFNKEMRKNGYTKVQACIGGERPYIFKKISE